MKTLDEIKSESLAWEQAHRYMGLDDSRIASGMKPETLALIQSEIDRIGTLLAAPISTGGGTGYAMAIKYELDFLGKVLESERKR